MADPDIVKSFGTAASIIESAPFTRYLQPAPTANNTAKLLAVYERSQDGQQAPSTLIAACGSPVQLKPNTNYVVSPRLDHVLNNGSFNASDTVNVRGQSIYVLSDEYRPLYGHEKQFRYYTESNMPPGPPTRTTILIVPNPGKRRISLGFRADEVGCEIDVIAQYSPTAIDIASALALSHTVLPSVPANTVKTGVAEMAPLLWEFSLRAVSGAPPTQCRLAVSFHDEV